MLTERPGQSRGRVLRSHRRSATTLLAARGAAFAVALSVIGSATACTIPTSAPSASTGTTTHTTPQVSSTPFAPPISGALPTVVVLDPGHNGGNAAAPAEIGRPVPAGGFTKPCNTIGAQTTAGYPEHAFAFDVAQRAADLLRAKGVTVVLTRTDDSGVGPCVNERADAANKAGAALMVSIHADGADPGVRGFHVIKPALAPDGGNADILEPSEQAAFNLLTAFSAVTAEPMATYPGGLVQPGLSRRDDLAGLNLARVPAVFIECGNMRNPDDGTAIANPNWRQRAAQGIADGVLMYLTSRPRAE